ncbi:MAG: hypothetical protein IJY33_05325 [Oscillospiraceae bacterium]|nr:hypothetical protein [Oscillospiraceae bacterium]
MIELRYCALESDKIDFKFLHSDAPDGANPVYQMETVQDSIKKNTNIINYANFFKDGIDLYDETIELGGEGDYYGWLIFDESATLQVSYSGTDVDPPTFENGITIFFNKYTCKMVEVYIETKDDGWVNIGGAYNENGLPEKVHLEIKSDQYPTVISDNAWEKLKIDFAFPATENDPINVKGVQFGKTIELDDVMSYDNISEINPIGDDLAINETSLTAVVAEDFYGEDGQDIIVLDNDQLFEKEDLKKVEEIDTNLYDFKFNNFIGTVDGISCRNYGNYDSLFKQGQVNVKSALESLGIDISYPEELSTVLLSSLYPPATLRQTLQQISWATCCGIDTTYSEKVRLVPFFAPDQDEEVSPDIIISNNDDRILKSNITKGEIYSEILWKRPQYTLKKEKEVVGTIYLTETTDELGNKSKDGILISDTPFYYGDMIDNLSIDLNEFSVNIPSPYIIEVGMYYEEHFSDWDSIEVSAYKYEKSEHTIRISTGNKGNKKLEITNQQIYPINPAYKMAQLKKWYSNNNTLSATIVDNDSQIRLGKVVKIQLKNGNYFQGIVTKIVRNNISSYHTVDLEAHEWN